MTTTDSDARRLRCSDREREQVASAVHEAAGADRLTLDEVGVLGGAALALRGLLVVDGPRPGPGPFGGPGFRGR
ncbi:hypothetical protein [Pseudonocardia xishanensis]|uniref:Uncharacterized protein n=1 Tax=Pseudonocardia xishanensis TaxID=630995 RepID=A0ABP8RSH8_9PSEU